MTLEDYLHNLNSAKNPEEAFQTFQKALGDLGFDRVSYTLCTDHPSLDLPKQHGLSTSYPEDWMNYYIEKDYLSVDPVVNELLQENRIFKWDDITKKHDKNSPSYKLMMEAEDANITDGIGVSITTPYDEITGIGIARSCRTKEKIDDVVYSHVFFLARNFHDTYRTLKKNLIREKFSKNQKSVLYWATKGKTDIEISMILDLSYGTIRYHWTKIFEKLYVYSRSQAIEKAIYFNLVKEIET